VLNPADSLAQLLSLSQGRSTTRRGGSRRWRPRTGTVMAVHATPATSTRFSPWPASWSSAPPLS